MRRRKKSWFGRTFGIWDLILIFVILGLGGWILYDLGISGTLSDLRDALFVSLIVGFIIKFLIQRAKR